MSGFLYFLPGVAPESLVRENQVDQSLLAECGLAGTLEDCRKVPDHLVVAGGTSPDAQRGALLYPVPVDGDVPKILKVDTGVQTWLPKQTKDLHWWLGWYNDSPPTTADLERRILIDGYVVQDAYDCNWQVPVLRAVDNPRGRLSPCFTWDEQDRPVMGVDPRFAQLWEDSARAWDLIDKSSSETGGTFTQDFSAADDQWLFDYVVRCLAINYRVSNRELSALNKISPGWLSRQTASLFLNSTVDLFKWKQWLASQKKTLSPSAADGSPGGSGSAA